MASEARIVRVASPSYQAYQILHVAFTVAPIVAGMDKFFHSLVNWDIYLSPLVEKTLGIPAHSFMLGVGVIEVMAGLLVSIAVGLMFGVWPARKASRLDLVECLRYE